MIARITARLGATLALTAVAAMVVLGVLPMSAIAHTPICRSAASQGPAHPGKAPAAHFCQDCLAAPGGAAFVPPSPALAAPLGHVPAVLEERVIVAVTGQVALHLRARGPPQTEIV